MQTNETKRLVEQNRIDSGKSQLERNRLGQFATSAKLARQIAEYVVPLLDHQAISFIDPAIGSGSFFSALLDATNGQHIERASGIEIDPQMADVCNSLWSDSGLSVCNADFTLSNPPIAEEERFNLILANPPYVRHHHLDSQSKIRLNELATRLLGTKVSGLAGLYCYFMLLSHDWMQQDAIAAWLIPSEFMDVNYGVALKKYLLEQVQLLHIHRYDPSELQFDDALVSSAVVIFKNGKPHPDHSAKFSFGGSIANPQTSRDITIQDLHAIHKWTSLPLRTHHQSNKNCLADFFDIRRGIATGANEFFIMPLSQAEQLGITREFLKPILPSPRNLKNTTINSRNDGFPDLNDPLVLIDTDHSEDHIKNKCPALIEYLQTGIANGLQEKYLISKRTPWYKQEQRLPSPFLCTYMGRSLETKPFRFIWNKSKAIVANTYLMLYPIGKLKLALETEPALYESVFELLQNIKLEDLVSEGRVYGGGLYKLEPAELGRVDATAIGEKLSPYLR
jgi:adenine-specific DNA-methyltransferase